MINEHPSGIEDQGELAYVSAEFFRINGEAEFPSEEIMWAALLSFQKGWKACKDFYKISD